MSKEHNATSRSIVERHRRHVEITAALWPEVRDYALMVCDDILNDLPSETTPSEIAQFEEAKKVIAWANNSLFGSHGYFLSDRGGPANEHHLDMPIERLKADCNRWYRAASPYATPEALAEALCTRSATRRGPDDGLSRFHEYLDQTWPLWKQHVGSVHYVDQRRAFFAGLDVE